MGIKRRKVGPVLSAREVAFIKVSSLTDDNTLSSGITIPECNEVNRL